MLESTANVAIEHCIFMGNRAERGGAAVAVTSRVFPSDVNLKNVSMGNEEDRPLVTKHLGGSMLLVQRASRITSSQLSIKSSEHTGISLKAAICVFASTHVEKSAGHGVECASSSLELSESTIEGNGHVGVAGTACQLSADDVRMLGNRRGGIRLSAGSELNVKRTLLKGNTNYGGKGGGISCRE